MRRFRGLLIGLGILLVVLVIVGLAWRTVIRRSWPQTNGIVEVPGLIEPVEIIRDRWGVPHIYAQNSHDLFFAQGYVHAQDRFWQMEFWRRIGSGRLAEILGEDALEKDRFIRTLGWRQVAEAEVALLDDETRAALDAYAQGVNAYLEEHRGRLGLEFTILALNGTRFEPEPWTPVDSLTWGKVMAWDLGGNRKMELLRARLIAQVGLGRLHDYLRPYPEDSPVIVPSEVSWRREDVAGLDLLARRLGEGLVLGHGMGIGSNNWVVSGAKSVTGMPLLANDPHLSIQMPSIWYEVGLHCGERCPYNVVGFSFAGVPGVIIGHNGRIAWGVTNAGPDVQDLYVEKINPQNPDQYEYQGEWVDMEVRYEEIQVAGREEPLVIKVRRTRHGPIINDVVHGPDEAWAYGWQPLALRWTALEPGTLHQAVLALDRAQNWEEFREALRLWDVPAQNFVYADVEGNIGYQLPGRIPIRAKGDGSMPVPGWTGEYEWVGTIPYEELPSRFNPPEGFIVTANNAIVDAGYPYLIAREWAAGYRARRITDLLMAQEKFSVRDFARIQNDSYNLSAGEVLPYLLSLQPEEPELAEALERLADWDLQMRRESVPAAIYAAFWTFLMEDTFADELGQRPGGGDEEMVAIRYLLERPDNPWWDNVTTPDRVETRDEVLLQALADGVRWLRERLGGKMDRWTWGRIHTATFRNQSLGKSGIRLIEGLFNRGPVAVDGGTAIVNATSWSAREPAEVVGVPSMRQIVDLSDFEASLSVHTTGQSGHPYHPHYADMIPLWRDGEYHPMHWERSAIEADAEGVLQLVPVGGGE